MLLNLVLGNADGVSDAYHGFSFEGSATFLVGGRQSAVTDLVGRQDRRQPALNTLRFHGLSLGPEMPTTKFNSDAKIDPTGDGAPHARRRTNMIRMSISLLLALALAPPAAAVEARTPVEI